MDILLFLDLFNFWKVFCLSAANPIGIMLGNVLSAVIVPDDSIATTRIPLLVSSVLICQYSNTGTHVHLHALHTHVDMHRKWPRSFFTLFIKSLVNHCVQLNSLQCHLERRRKFVSYFANCSLRQKVHATFCLVI